VNAQENYACNTPAVSSVDSIIVSKFDKGSKSSRTRKIFNPEHYICSWISKHQIRSPSLKIFDKSLINASSQFGKTGSKLYPAPNSFACRRSDSVWEPCQILYSSSIYLI
jgi:hypothetical protein